MRYTELDGVVLRRHNLGEADRIIVFFSPQMGKVSSVARGVRKIKSRLAGSLEPFTAIQLRFVKGKSMYTVIGARARTVYNLEACGYDSLRAGLLILEMTERLVGEGQTQDGVYELLLECFEGLGDNIEPIVVIQYFAFEFLDRLGYLPDVPVAGEGTDLVLDLEHGTFADGKSGIGVAPISQSMLKLWKLCQIGQLNDIARVKGVSELSTQAWSALLQFYQYRFDIEFKSLKIL